MNEDMNRRIREQLARRRASAQARLFRPNTSSQADDNDNTDETQREAR